MIIADRLADTDERYIRAVSCYKWASGTPINRTDLFEEISLIKYLFLFLYPRLLN